MTVPPFSRGGVRGFNEANPNELNAFALSLRAIPSWQESVAISPYQYEIAEHVPSETRNLGVCFGFPSQ